MTPGRSISLIVSVALHAGVLWAWKSHTSIPLAAGEPEGPKVDVELVEAGPPQEPVPVETTPPPPVPQPPDPTPPDPTPPDPTPPEPTPPPPPPNVMEDPRPAEPPKPKPKSVSRPAAPQPAKPGPPRPATAPAPTGKAPGASAGGTDGEARARYKNKVKPTYPDSLRRSGIQGRVQVLATVSAQGRTVSARIAHSSGNALFDEAALSAARASEFYPKKTLGVPVPDTVLIPYNFEIEN